MNIADTQTQVPLALVALLPRLLTLTTLPKAYCWLRTFLRLLHLQAPTLSFGWRRDNCFSGREVVDDDRGIGN